MRTIPCNPNAQPDFFHDAGRTVGSGRIGMTEPKL